MDYRLAHGEAVAIGMVAATRLARMLGVVSEDFEPRLVALLTEAGLPMSFPEEPGLFDRVVKAMQLDKKFRDGKNLFVLPTRVGEWEQQVDVEWERVYEAIRGVLG